MAGRSTEVAGPPGSSIREAPRRLLVTQTQRRAARTTVKKEKARVRWETTSTVERLIPSRPARSAEATLGARREVSLQVVDLAASTRKPILLYFHGSAGAGEEKACLRLEDRTFGVAKVIELSRDFHMVRIDAGRIDREIRKRYRVDGAPAVVVLDSRGNVIRRLLSQITPWPVHSAMLEARRRSRLFTASTSD